MAARAGIDNMNDRLIVTSSTIDDVIENAKAVVQGPKQLKASVEEAQHVAFAHIDGTKTASASEFEKSKQSIQESIGHAIAKFDEHEREIKQLSRDSAGHGGGGGTDEHGKLVRSNDSMIDTIKENPTRAEFNDWILKLGLHIETFRIGATQRWCCAGFRSGQRRFPRACPRRLLNKQRRRRRTRMIRSST